MSIRTDLAAECIGNDDSSLPEGIKRNIRKSTCCTITEIIVETDQAGMKIGKCKGKYITVETDRLSAHPDDFSQQAEDISAELSALAGDVKNLFVMGLGNRDITPDALGPMTASGIISTRHLENIPGIPDLIKVSAAAPGVLGQTGIEASEITSALCRTVKPDCVIAIDALACRDVSRLGTTIQLTDTGITPGSGVRNHRRELSQNTLGIPVIAVGVPTIIDMHTIAENITGKAPDKHLPNMMVTPRDIDELVRRTSKLLAFAINKTVQKNLSDTEIISLM